VRLNAFIPIVSIMVDKERSKIPHTNMKTKSKVEAPMYLLCKDLCAYAFQNACRVNKVKFIMKSSVAKVAER